MTGACSTSVESIGASLAISKMPAAPRHGRPRVSTIVGFYRYAEEEGVIEHSPAVHVRRPRIDYESHVAHLDRNELGAILVPPVGLGQDHARLLVGVERAAGVRGDRRRHRSPRPRARPPHTPRPAQGRQDRHRSARPASRPSDRPQPSANAATGRSSSSPTAGGSTATPPGGSCDGSPGAPGSPSGSGHTRCATRSSLPRSMPVCRCATCRKPRRTLTHGPRCATTAAASLLTVTPPNGRARGCRSSSWQEPLRRHRPAGRDRRGCGPSRWQVSTPRHPTLEVSM